MIKKEPGPFRADDFFKLFVTFCAVIVASIATLVAINPTTPLGVSVNDLLSKLWFPNYREQAIFTTVGSSWIFFHNMIRFLLTVFAPLLLWTSTISIWKAWKTETQRGQRSLWYVLAIALFALEAICLIDVFYFGSILSIISGIGFLVVLAALIGIALIGEARRYPLFYVLIIALFEFEAVFLVDRFTYIAIIGIPLVLAALYRVFYRLVKRTSPKTMFRTTFLKISFYSLILSEIYSTAIAIADRYMFALPGASESFYQGGNLGLLSYLLILIPHGLIEIPAAMLAALIGLYVARRMTVKIDEDEKRLDKFLAEGRNTITSSKVWYPILFVAIFFAVAAGIEIYVTWRYIEPLVNAFGFA